MGRQEATLKRPTESRRPRLWGIDELNFAEFPLAALTDHLNAEQKSLVFEDDVFDDASKQRVHRKLIISGSDLYGLPTPLDSDVLLIAIDLTSRQNGFSDRRVPFARSEFLSRLPWDSSGKSYRRLDESLQRWAGTTLYFVGSWWDRRINRWQSQTFHVFESLNLKGRQARGINAEDGLSSFTWNEVVFASFQANNIRRLDLNLYFSLERPASRRMFRFLDKRFYHSRRLEFDLRTFAFEHIGFSRCYGDVSQLKRKMRPALAELEERGFLTAAPESERFHRKGMRQWAISLEKQGRRDTSVSAPAIEHPSGVVESLVAQGVRRETAIELTQKATPDVIQRQLEVFTWRKARNDKRIARNPPGFLVSAIRGDFAPPADFDGGAKLTKVQPNTGRRQKVALPMPPVTPANAAESPLNALWSALPADEQARIEAEAMAIADPVLLEGYQRSSNSGHKNTAESYRRMIINQHLAKHSATVKCT